MRAVAASRLKSRGCNEMSSRVLAASRVELQAFGSLSGKGA